MSGYEDWLYARSCDNCQHGRGIRECAGSVWIDGSRVRCSCQCGSNQERTEAIQGPQSDGPTDSHADAAGLPQVAKNQPRGVVSDSPAPANTNGESTRMEFDGRGDE